MDTIKADQIVEIGLRSANSELSKVLGSEVIALKAPMRPPLDEIIRTEIEEIKRSYSKKDKKEKIAVILETSGGYIEPVERIALTLRKAYNIVEFIIPNYAYSAGTVLAMSGDEIYMDYFSVLGPIDPQYPSEDGGYLPGMGYLAKFNELVDMINADTEGAKTRAQLAFLLRKFDPARLFDIEQAVEHSKSLLEEWLPKYKFKDWNVTEGTGKAVTPEYKKDRAVRIATALGNTERWHSHGRGITIRELMDEEINLKVVDFGNNPQLNAAIRHYHGLFIDYMNRRGMKGAMHDRRGMRRVA